MFNQHIPLSTRGKATFTPPSISSLPRFAAAADFHRAPTFQIHIPTYAQRDTIGSLLFKHGLLPVTIEHGRAVLISEIYEVYASAEPETGRPPEGKQLGDPDEISGFLESYWARSEVHNEAVSQWGMQEAERLIDELKGAPAREGDAAPVPPFTTRETARAQRIAVEMLAHSKSYCELQSRYGEEEANENLMLFRVFVAGWDQFETVPMFDTMGKLSLECVEQLRGEFERLGCSDAYLETVRFVRDQFALDKVTEKNSVSPLASGSSPSGLSDRSAELDASDGSSTRSNTERAPRSGSRPTSDTSSISRSGPGTKRSKSSQTAPAS